MGICLVITFQLWRGGCGGEALQTPGYIHACVWLESPEG